MSGSSCCSRTFSGQAENATYSEWKLDRKGKKSAPKMASVILVMLEGLFGGARAIAKAVVAVK